jgi:hypothetical protein
VVVIVGAGATVICKDVDFVESATEVAVTVATVLLDTLGGAL